MDPVDRILERDEVQPSRDEVTFEGLAEHVIDPDTTAGRNREEASGRSSPTWQETHTGPPQDSTGRPQAQGRALKTDAIAAGWVEAQPKAWADAIHAEG